MTIYGGSVYGGLHYKAASTLVLTPPGLATLVAWFDGQDIDLLGNTSIADGAPVTTWKNKGSLGASGDMTQASVPAKPAFKLVAATGKIRNKSSLLFSGAQELTSGNVTLMTAPIKMAGVVLRTASAGDVYWDGNDATNRSSFFSVGSWSMYAGGVVSSAGAPVDNTYNQTTQYWNDATSVLRMNGAEVAAGNVGTAKLDGFRVGVGGDNTSFLTGEVIEWCVWYGGAFPSDADVEAYFTAKYSGGWPQ